MSMKPEVRERIRAEMLPLIQAWQASGEGRRVFAARHGISLPKFDDWVRQAGLTRRRPTRAAPDFAAVTVVPSGPEPGVLEIVSARGDRLIVRAEADIALVRTVLTAFWSKC